MTLTPQTIPVCETDPNAKRLYVKCQELHEVYGVHFRPPITKENEPIPLHTTLDPTWFYLKVMAKGAANIDRIGITIDTNLPEEDAIALLELIKNSPLYEKIKGQINAQRLLNT